jgi:hypothetical protein
MPDGKISNKQRIDQREYGGICTNSERKREHSDSGEAAISRQDADGVAQVVPKRPHGYRSCNLGFKDRLQIYAGSYDLSTAELLRKGKSGYWSDA